MGFDVIIVVLLLLFGMKGFLFGFRVEILNFIGIIGGIFIASRVAKSYASTVQNGLSFIENKAMAELLLFFLTLLSIFFITKLFQQVPIQVKDGEIEDGDNENSVSKYLGYSVSVLKYFMVFSIILSVISHTPLKDRIEYKVQDSLLYKKMVKLGNFILNEKELDS